MCCSWYLIPFIFCSKNKDTSVRDESNDLWFVSSSWKEILFGFFVHLFDTQLRDVTEILCFVLIRDIIELAACFKFHLGRTKDAEHE